MSSRYRYPVHSVKSCPTDAKSWDEAARRRNCSLDLDPKIIRNRYQCVPDADEPRPLVEKGISKYIFGLHIFTSLIGMFVFY